MTLWFRYGELDSVGLETGGGSEGEFGLWALDLGVVIRLRVLHPINNIKEKKKKEKEE